MLSYLQRFRLLIIAFLVYLFWPSQYLMSQKIRYTGLIEGNLLRRKEIAQNSITNNSSIGQNYRLGFRGSIIDPQFLVYFIGSTFNNVKNDYESLSSTERNLGYYDISVRLFPEKKHSFRFFSKRNKIQTLFDNYDDFNGHSTRTGFRWQFVGKRYPTMSLRLQRYHFKALRNDKSNILTEFNLSQQHGNMSYIRLNYKGNLEKDNITGAKTSYVDLRFEGKSKIGKKSRIVNYSSYYARKFLTIYRSNIRLDFNYGKKNTAQLFFKFFGQNSYKSRFLSNQLQFRMRRALLTGLTMQSNLGLQNNTRDSKADVVRQNSANSNLGVVYQKYLQLKFVKLGSNLDCNLNYQVTSPNKGEGFIINGARLEAQMGNFHFIHIAGGTGFNTQFSSRSNRNIFSFSYNGDLFIGFIPRITLRSRFNQRFSGGDIYQDKTLIAEKQIPSSFIDTYNISNSNYLTVTKWENELRLKIMRSMLCSAGYEINDRKAEINRTSVIARAYLMYTPTRNINMRITFHRSYQVQFKYLSYWLDSRLEYKYRRLTISLEYTERSTESLFMNQSKTFKVKIKRPIGDSSPWGEEYSSSGRRH